MILFASLSTMQKDDRTAKNLLVLSWQSIGFRYQSSCPMTVTKSLNYMTVCPIRQSCLPSASPLASVLSKLSFQFNSKKVFIFICVLFFYLYILILNYLNLFVFFQKIPFFAVTLLSFNSERKPKKKNQTA